MPGASDVNVLHAFEAAIFVITVTVTFISGWMCALGGTLSGAGACTCIFLCDWKPHVDVVAVQPSLVFVKARFCLR
jgi:hypothetical protein